MSSVLLYLARNVLISWSSLVSRDPVMNTSEPLQEGSSHTFLRQCSKFIMSIIGDFLFLDSGQSRNS